MAISIERKFLVNEAAFESAKNLKLDTFEETILQGYLFNGLSRSVRVRIRNNKGKLTFKGARSLGGMARNEVRLTVPLSLAKFAINLVGVSVSFRNFSNFVCNVIKTTSQFKRVCAVKPQKASFD